MLDWFCFLSFSILSKRYSITLYHNMSHFICVLLYHIVTYYNVLLCICIVSYRITSCHTAFISFCTFWCTIQEKGHPSPHRALQWLLSTQRILSGVVFGDVCWHPDGLITATYVFYQDLPLSTTDGLHCLQSEWRQNSKQMWHWT